MVTEGVFTPQGEFLPLPTPATYILADIEERFRKLLLKRLHRAERLSETFMNKLLEWNPSGFSVHAEPAFAKATAGRQLVYDDEIQKLENLARYLTRAPINLGSITQTPEGQVYVTTPPHPLTGNTVLVLDALDWIHAICQQIPDRGQHLYRYYGAYSNRTRKALPQNDLTQTPVTFPEQDFDKPSPDSAPSRASWARLIRKVFEIDPLLCGKCGAEMKIIAVLTDPKAVDRIIRHLEQNPTRQPKAPRAPPHPSKTLDDNEIVPAHVNV